MTHAAGNVDTQGAPWQIQELLRPEAFQHPVGQLQLRETHISWVILTGSFAYKIKKPVQLEFIDAATLARRHALCLEEVRLNRRLVPDLYLSVEPIARVGGRLLVGGAGTALEYAVRMQQFAADDELQALLAADAVSTKEIQLLAELLAQFHAQAALANAADLYASAQQLREAVLDNVEQLLAHLSPADLATGINALRDWIHRQTIALQSEILARAQGGCIRECHGDLHAANIVRWHGQLVPFDCLEFDPRLRWIDVIDDIAFLVMDLVSRQRSDLAFALLSRYLETTGDYAGVSLLRFYAVHRALVRAKVDAVGVQSVPQHAAQFRTRLGRRIATAMQWTAPPAPTLLIMHGPSGSGKSWLSERLVPALPAIRMRSDVERKRLAGIAAHESAAAGLQQGIYAPQFSHRTYARLADCAQTCLRAGYHVIVDAAFLDAADRELFRNLAARVRAGFVIVSCQTDALTQAARVLERSRTHEDASDADLSVLDAQLRGLQPFTAPERRHLMAVDAKAEGVVERIVSAVSGGPHLPT